MHALSLGLCRNFGMLASTALAHLRSSGCKPYRLVYDVKAFCVLAVQSYNLGNKTEMLVAVRQPEGKQGPTTVTLTTDQPADIVLHWGVRKGGKGDWLPPPK